MQSPPPKYRFGPFVFCARTRQLTKEGVKLKLRPQPLRVLELLVQRPEDVVSREELRTALWPAETFVDFERGLNTAIKELRGALSDSASEPKYIETLPKVGYRMIAAVERIVTESPSEGIQPVAWNQVERRKPWIVLANLRARYWPLLSLLGLLVAAAIVAGVWAKTRSAPRAAVEASGRPMLAVLPFENLTGDAEQDYFSDGLTEEMIAQLGRLDPQHIGVIGRTSVMRYKLDQRQLQQIGRELGVQYVLEGSVRRDAYSLRVSAKLIQVKDQTQLWSRQYDRELSSLLALQGEIAHEISDEIELTFGERGARRVAPGGNVPALSAKEVAAYDLYLQGLYFFNKRTSSGFEQAIQYFSRAIEKAPNYAPPYAGLADCYALISGYSMKPQAESIAKARAAALRALAIDEKLPEAHTALALIVQNYDWDWSTSEKEFRRALELNPNYATAHHWYAEHLAWQGRFDEALQESERARRLDPMSLIIAADDGAILYYARQYDRSIERFRAVLQMDPDFPRAGLVFYSYVEKGMYDEALLLTEQHRPAHRDGWYWSSVAYAYGRSGRRADADQGVARMENWMKQEERQHRPMDVAALVPAYIAVNNKDKAFDFLEKGYAEHANAMTGLKVDPMYDPLRSDPRFQDLLRRVRLNN